MVNVAESYCAVKPRELNFDEGTIYKRLKTMLFESKAEKQESFWARLKSNVIKSLKEIVEGCLQQEACQESGASWHERSLARIDYRNGIYKRNLGTSFGEIKKLIVPRLRNKKLQFKVFKRYKRRLNEVDELSKNIFLAGVSTRRVEEVIKPLLGSKYSPQLVSNILKGLDEQVRKFHERGICDDELYLIFDGLTIKVRYNGKVHKKRALVCYGIRKNGKREIVDYALAKGESTLSMGDIH